MDTSWVASVTGMVGNAFNSWMTYETAKVNGGNSYYRIPNVTAGAGSGFSGLGSTTGILIIGLIIVLLFRK